MQQRTFFTIFTHETSPRWFSAWLVLLRASVGGFAFLFGLERLHGWSPALVSVDAFFRLWFLESFPTSFFASVLPWILLIGGAFLFLGACVRPASVGLCVVFFLLFCMTFDADLWVNSFGVLMACCLFFLSGGVGHVLGLDYFLYSYERDHTWIIRFLFG